MSEVRESFIEQKIVRHCKARGYYVRKLGSRNYNGLPDRMICFKGKIIFLEIKRPKQKPTPLQERELSLLRAAGMHATWCDSYEKAVEILDDWFSDTQESNDGVL